jgi:hypothetical protein
MTGERGEHMGHRYWPVDAEPDPAAPAAGQARVIHITAGQAEIIVPRPESAVSAQLGGLFDLFPELRDWHRVTSVTADLAHSTADLALSTAETVRELADRVIALEGGGELADPAAEYGPDAPEPFYGSDADPGAAHYGDGS